MHLGIKKTLQEGLSWRVGSGSSISIFNNPWISGSFNYRLSDPSVISDLVHVNELIDSHKLEWKVELVRNTFVMTNAE